MTPLLPLNIVSVSENFMEYFNAVNPLFLNEEIKNIHLISTEEKVYLQVTQAKEIYLNKLSFVVDYINLDKVISDCDCDINPDGLMFRPENIMDTMIDDFVNLGEDCLMEIFESHHVNEEFIAQHFELIAI